MSEWSSGDVTANGIKVHYYRTGGDKPPLVLAHGFSDNGLCWTRIVQVLEHRYDVIMADARGHGLSNAPHEGYSSEDHAADLAGLIQALGLGKPALMGHSMGASTVATTAVTYPALVACAILEDPPWFGKDAPWARNRADLTPEQQKADAEKRRAEIVERTSQTREEIMAFGRANSPTWDEIEFGPWADSKRQLSPNVINRSALQQKPWQEVVPQIQCPTLLVTADPDKAIVTPEIARQAAEMNGHIQVVRLEGAGHNVRREQFGPFVEAVTEFLSQTYG
jgi:pimeloyl-ACP methyl ester carboxylesterase